MDNDRTPDSHEQQVCASCGGRAGSLLNPGPLGALRQQRNGRYLHDTCAVFTGIPNPSRIADDVSLRIIKDAASASSLANLNTNFLAALNAPHIIPYAPPAEPTAAEPPPAAPSEEERADPPQQAEPDHTPGTDRLLTAIELADREMAGLPGDQCPVCGGERASGYLRNCPTCDARLTNEAGRRLADLPAEEHDPVLIDNSARTDPQPAPSCCASGPCWWITNIRGRLRNWYGAHPHAEPPITKFREGYTRDHFMRKLKQHGYHGRWPPPPQWVDKP